MTVERQVCGARRCGRHVHGGVDGGAIGRVLARLAIGVMLIGRVLRNRCRSRSGESGGHGGCDRYGRGREEERAAVLSSSRVYVWEAFADKVEQR